LEVLRKPCRQRMKFRQRHDCAKPVSIFEAKGRHHTPVVNRVHIEVCHSITKPPYQLSKIWPLLMPVITVSGTLYRLGSYAPGAKLIEGIDWDLINQRFLGHNQETEKAVDE